MNWIWDALAHQVTQAVMHIDLHFKEGASTECADKSNKMGTFGKVFLLEMRSVKTGKCRCD